MQATPSYALLLIVARVSGALDPDCYSLHPCPMTKQEFITRQQALTRATNKRLGFWMVFFFAALCGCIPLSSYIERHEQDYRWIGTAFGIGLLTFLCANLGLMAWYGLRQQRRYGHRCPHCNKSLVGFGAQIAIATGNCGQCGESVFSDQAG